MKQRIKQAIALILLLSAGSAWAHPGHLEGGFATGLVHPLLGLDHWLAMLGLGLWSAAVRLPRQALATVCIGLAAGALVPHASGDLDLKELRAATFVDGLDVPSHGRLN